VDIAFENVQYEPEVGTKWIRPTVLPAQSDVLAMSDSGLEVHEGVFQVDVFTDINKGKSDSLTTADDISSYFARGLALTYSGVSVRIIRKSTGTSSRDGAWYMTSLLIDYQSIT
jgi:hypothetical protein